ncbi:glucan 1,3-beta-glucosidase 2 [Apodospora peruviana]|uniref:glucan 1,3-beta-glucosidase n=1 Tax=Apodospora peruviana TaxID=516989 RepID=A0AAE0I037_9PEZI|nr:glucan 1,3-beta-glucosidase 2 [Apodospora peruviana]
MAPRESEERPPPRRRRESSARRERERGDREHRKSNHARKKSASTSEDTTTGTGSSGLALSSAALAKLNQENVKRLSSSGGEQQQRTRDKKDRRDERDRDRGRDRERDRERERKLEREEEDELIRLSKKRRSATARKQGGRESRSRDGYREVKRDEYLEEDERIREKRRSSKARVVSGAVLEEGRGRGHDDHRHHYGRHGLRGGDGSSYDSWEMDEVVVKKSTTSPKWWHQKKFWILIGIGVVILILIIVVAVVVGKNNSGDGDGGGDSSGDKSSGSLDSISPSSIPAGAPAWLNPFQWLDTNDFNLTYTNATVGDLPIMGLFSKWDDSAAANEHVPALNKDWGDYASRPARGVNVGGWLTLEPFITPSLFNYDLRKGIIDEYTLCAYLGSKCAATLEQHYSTFVTEDTFRDIAAAGLDHVRIPFSYWAVQTYDGDPYVFRTSWRYLLRGIEWARKYGLRINLDLHGLPGSQNGWNHSGRQGAINWLDGPDGATNAQRSLDIHDRLSKFFAQSRYKNIISHYGLANEPKMTDLSVPAVLQWTQTAHDLVRKNGITDAVVVFGDGFRGLGKWQGELQGNPRMALDVHQYVIFNTNQIVFNHSEKVRYACEGWGDQTALSMNTATGYGPTMVAEWSQADTDCAKHLTNVGWGNRWTGTYVTGDSSLDITTPRCPAKDHSCDCIAANAQPDQWSDQYKQFLRMFAEAQMSTFEKGWGWFYWVWDTEDAPQWSYKKGMAAGVLPTKAYDRDFDCSSDIPSFDGLPETY